MNFVAMRTYTLEQVLICAYCEIAVNGWTSSSATERANAGVVGPAIRSTKDNVRVLLLNDGRGGEARKALMTEAKEMGLDLFGDSVKEEVQTIIEWAKNLVAADVPMFGTVPDYKAVVSLMARRGTVDPASLGYAVSIIPSYRKDMNKQQNSKSNWVGQMRRAVTADVTVEKITSNTPTAHTRYARQRHWWLIVTKDDNENVLKWFVTTEPKYKAGDRIRITGNVQKHEEWKGMKSTKLSGVVWELINFAPGSPSGTTDTTV
jgi:hypothetical protein